LAAKRQKAEGRRQKARKKAAREKRDYSTPCS